MEEWKNYNSKKLKVNIRIRLKEEEKVTTQKELIAPGQRKSPANQSLKNLQESHLHTQECKGSLHCSQFK